MMKPLEANKFVSRYPQCLQEIRSVIRPELFPQLKELDPHDLITPESYFPNETTARGFVWRIFIKKVKESE